MKQEYVELRQELEKVKQENKFLGDQLKSDTEYEQSLLKRIDKLNISNRELSRLLKIIQATVAFEWEKVE